jgi:exopolyphosphatase/guanosine-5'-triphosphate,3'-diphosphate pyrophosphatase
MLLKAARAQCGWQVEVLCGQEEARLAFLGAAAGALASGASNILLLDIGGSSSELVRWQDGTMRAVSADMGAVRARVAGWPPAEIERRLAKGIEAEDSDKAALAIGAGGTVTTAAALLQGCHDYSREAVEGYSLQAQGVEELLTSLLPLSVEQRCAFSPLLAQRGEIICEGLWIVRAFLRLLKLPALTVSAGGVLEGCLADLKKRGLAPQNKMQV